MHAIEDEAQVVRTFVGHSDAITCLDVSCDGRLLVSGSRDKKIILWDIEKAQIINIYAGHEGSIFSVSFSYFGTIICSSGSDNSVRLWDKTEVITQNKQKKGECTQPVATYYTKNTPIFTVKFGYRNIVSCAGPFIS
ncbi:transcription initiation factor TFIID subunit TAF5 [Enterocytozoon bieneusi H348]|nr:transcription initiation factor TFIID subunit TAF5 [Enterocytozoon bieneusi H348]|eukprot:XP_002651360.1 transcription initiation factor TFIID subunit TAF5 [Enterocytozoon bieneusi H348]